MEPILLEQSYITNNYINRCIQRFEEIRELEKPLLQVKAVHEMTDVDILLIGYFMLFKEECPQLTIELIFDKNKKSDRNKVIYKLGQYAVYAYLMTEKVVFSAVFEDGTANYDPKANEHFFSDYYVLSEIFMIFCLISRKYRDDRYNLLFTTSLSEIRKADLSKGVRDVAWLPSSETLAANYMQKIRQDAKASDTIDAIERLALMSFYKSLDDTKILHLYTDENYHKDNSYRNPKLQAGDLRSHMREGKHPQYDYFKSVKGIFDDLSRKPAIYHLIFRTLTTQLLTGILTEKNTKIFTRKVFGLWRFTSDMVHGLLELVKNVDEHSSTRIGVITARIIPVHQLNELSPGRRSLFLDYLKSIKDKTGDNAESIMQMNVIDLGKKGVIPKLLDDSRNTLNEVKDIPLMFDLFQEDIDNMEKGLVKLDNLLSNDEVVLLNQQSKRSIAHLGLMTFSNLIIANKGLIIASSRNIDNKYEPVLVSKYVKKAIPSCIYGTNFMVVIPIFSEMGSQYDSTLPSMILPAESNAHELRGLESLLQYQEFDTSKKSPLVSFEEPVILLCKPELAQIQGRMDEKKLWQQVHASIESVLVDSEKSQKSIVSVNLEKAVLNASQLLRFLGLWENHYPKINLLVSNITTEVFLQLDEINLTFIQRNPTLHFWNEYSATFIYHYLPIEKYKLEEELINDLEREDRFYFTDVLWGRTEKDFIQLNKQLHRTYFNATTYLRKAADKDVKNSPGIRVPAGNDLVFYRNNTLLPFELLLAGKGNLTIYQHNAQVLLRNELQLKLDIES